VSFLLPNPKPFYQQIPNNNMLTTIQWLSIIGLILSIYFLYVRTKIRNTQYKPLCDINENISCTKAAKSKHSNVLILPNSIYGIIFYITIFLLSSLNLTLYTFIIAALATLFTIYLITISLKQKIYCPVCIATYIINFAILYLAV